MSKARKSGKPLINSDLGAEGLLNGLVRRNRFSDVVLGAWAIVEMNVNGVFQLTLGIESPHDKRVRIVDSSLSKFLARRLKVPKNINWT